MITTANLQQNFEIAQLELDPNKVLFHTNKDNQIVYEEFRDIPGYENMYQASNFGRIKSLDRKVRYSDGYLKSIKGFVLRQFKGKEYYAIVLQKKGKAKRACSHVIIAITFLGHTPCRYKIVVDHIDNNPLNNNVSNLQLITQRENTLKDKDKLKTTSKYIGVCVDSNSKKIYAHICKDGKQFYLGIFTNEKDASEYYKLNLKRIENNQEIIVKKPNWYSKHKGISFNKNRNKWVSRIYADGKDNNLGYFKTEQEAYEAREKALADILV